jgi:hypothetical protein
MSSQSKEQLCEDDSTSLFEFFDFAFHFLVPCATYNDIQKGRASVSVTSTRLDVLSLYLSLAAAIANSMEDHYLQS